MCASQLLQVSFLSLIALLDPLPEECCSGELQVDSSFNLSHAISSHDLSSIDSSRGGPGGLLILIPEMSFGCEGTISSWSGFVSVPNNSPPSGPFMMYMQIWRPRSEGSYDLIGRDILDSSNLDSSSQGDTVVSEANAQHQRKSYHQFHKEGDPISFQPGDILGCFIPPVPSAGLGNSSPESLGLAFQSTPLHGQKAVNLMVFDGVTGEPCEVFSCKKSPRTIPSVVPLLYPRCKGIKSACIV